MRVELPLLLPQAVTPATSASANDAPSIFFRFMTGERLAIQSKSRVRQGAVPRAARSR